MIKKKDIEIESLKMEVKDKTELGVSLSSKVAELNAILMDIQTECSVLKVKSFDIFSHTSNTKTLSSEYPKGYIETIEEDLRRANRVNVSNFTVIDGLLVWKPSE